MGVNLFHFFKTKTDIFGQNLTTEEVLEVVIFSVYSSGPFFLLNNDYTSEKQNMDKTINT